MIQESEDQEQSCRLKRWLQLLYELLPTFDLTAAVIGLQQEAQPVGRVVVGGQLTPEGVAQAGRRAQRPVAALSILPGRKV